MQIRDFRKGYTQTSLLGNRDYLEKLNFTRLSSNKRITKALQLHVMLPDCDMQKGQPAHRKRIFADGVRTKAQLWCGPSIQKSGPKLARH